MSVEMKFTDDMIVIRGERTTSFVLTQRKHGKVEFMTFYGEENSDENTGRD